MERRFGCQRYGSPDMQKRDSGHFYVNRIVPLTRCFERPDAALSFAGEEGCDVLLTGIELCLERIGHNRLAVKNKVLTLYFNIISAGERGSREDVFVTLR